MPLVVHDEGALHVSSLTVRTAPLCSFPASSRARRLLVGLRAHTRVGTR